MLDVMLYLILMEIYILPLIADYKEIFEEKRMQE
jgi:hypothetical protein